MAALGIERNMVIRAGCKERIPHYNIEIHMIEIAHVKIQGVLC